VSEVRSASLCTSRFDQATVKAGTVKNAVVGTGWTGAEGREGKASIATSAEGQTVEYKKVQFPAASGLRAELRDPPILRPLGPLSLSSSCRPD